MQDFLHHIRKYSPLSDEAQRALEACFEKHVITKNDFLLQEGQVCHYLYFIEKGAIRGYDHLDGKEITHWFGFENDFVTSLRSFITGKPSTENIQLIETTTLFAITKDTLTALFDQHHEIERLVRIIYENYYIRLEERLESIRFKTAAERYENLLNETPHILTRVPLGYIAAYLGISQETLSRIRGRV